MRHPCQGSYAHMSSRFSCAHEFEAQIEAALSLPYRPGVRNSALEVLYEVLAHKAESTAPALQARGAQQRPGSAV